MITKEVADTEESLKIKNIDSEFPIMREIAHRWSARSFSDKMLEEEKILELIEAARWAPSAMNEQPWRYTYAFRKTEGFEMMWNSLLPGNQPWAKNASVLMIAYAKTTYSSNGNPNGAALHDLGMANAQLFVQATHNNIFGHIMGGFDAHKLNEYFPVENDMKPVVMIALGYLDNHEKLDEPFKTREVTPRTRRTLNEISKRV